MYESTLKHLKARYEKKAFNFSNLKKKKNITIERKLVLFGIWFPIYTQKSGFDLDQIFPLTFFK